MQKNQLVIIGTLLLVVGFGGGYLFNGNPAPAGTHMMQDGTMMGQNIDQHFIVQMIPHHEGAIQMAKVALERSKRPEIISLANGIIEAQEKENRDMRSWYELWYGSVPTSFGMGMMHMDGMTGDIDALRAVSQVSFDRERQHEVRRY